MPDRAKRKEQRRTMDISGILQRVDTLYGENRGPEAERLMQEAIAVAAEEQDSVSLLQLLNELLGYYRETSQVENSYIIAQQAVAVAQAMGLEGSIPYATTLMNVANAYRAGGRLQDSLDCYLEVRRIYEQLLAPDHMLVASLENNISLLYQELGDFAGAKQSLLKALAIVMAQGAEFETAVTCANLAGTCMQLEEIEEARGYAQRAIQSFEEQGVQDAHYGAALSALGTYYYRTGNNSAAAAEFKRAMEVVEQTLGRNGHYYRLKENYEACLTAAKGEENQRKAENGSAKKYPQGLDLCREYYEEYVKPMKEEKFPDFAGKIAAGLAGEGSDCFGYDDEVSRDHDWGPDICLWVTKETYELIGQELQQAYEELPQEFKGYRRTQSDKGQGRRGVMTIAGFYRRLLQAADYEDIDWRQVSDASLAAAVNGEVFQDEEGIFTAFREKLKEGYPESVRFLKIAQSAALFSQSGQYNYKRMRGRGDMLTARMEAFNCIREAMKLQHYIEGVYPPHDKWLHRSLQDLSRGRELEKLLEEISEYTNSGEDVKESCDLGKRVFEQEGTKDDVMRRTFDRAGTQEDPMERTGAWFAKELYGADFISDIDSYLDAHTEELLQKSALSAQSNEELVERTARLEFEAFDKVQNVGGRASCQNDWATFSIMRKSQYLTWNRTMLLQYLYDFYREYHRGHNLITEKYGRMMESTAREEYDRIKENFPEISPEKKAIIEEIVRMQVKWMEEFSAKYPHLADNARSVHTYEDNLYNTSYETYLRGEISTYSDKMLELYGRFIVSCAAEGRNLAYDTMKNSVYLYGYKSLEEAEGFLGL